MLATRRAVLSGSLPKAWRDDSSGPASSTSTLSPASASTMAATPPVAPEPTTMASGWVTLAGMAIFWAVIAGVAQVNVQTTKPRQETAGALGSGGGGEI